MVVPTSNRPFINARSAISLIPSGQPTPNQYVLELTADANEGATSINIKIDTVNGQNDSAALLELEDDHQIWLPGNQTVHCAAAAASGKRKIVLDDGSGNAPNLEAGDFIKFANHQTIYRVGRVNAQNVRIFPQLSAPVVDNEVVSVFQEVRVSMGSNEQVVNIDTTGVTVNVASLKYTVTAANSKSLDVREEKQIFGLTTMGVSPVVNSIDASDTRSPVKDFITGAGLTANIETLAMDSELARPEILLGTLLNTNIVATTGFYLNVKTAAGEIYQGPASPSQSASANTRGQIETFNISFSFVLDNTNYWLVL